MCDRVALPGGGFAIVCGGHRGRRARCACGQLAPFLCDAPQCDRPICGRCRIHVPPAQDYCRDHRAQAAAAAAQLRLEL